MDCLELQRIPFEVRYKSMDEPRTPGGLPPIHTAIIGGGIIGLCSAFMALSHHTMPEGSTVTIIENSRLGLHQGASSSSLGMLTAGTGYSWCMPATKSLADLSLKTHEELATLFFHGAQEYGWTKCATVSVKVGSMDENRKSTYRTLSNGKKELLKDQWLLGERLSDDRRRLAQINPALFCQRLVRALRALGCKFLYADIISMLPQRSDVQGRDLILAIRPSGPVDGPILRDTLLFQKILIAAGPWSDNVCGKLGLPAILLQNLPEHSILIRPALSAVGYEAKSSLPAEVVFAGFVYIPGVMNILDSTGILNDTTSGLGMTAAPEILSRMDGLVFVGGEDLESSIQLEGVHHDVEGLPYRMAERVEGISKLEDPALIQRLKNSASTLSPALDVKNGAVIEQTKLCHISSTPDGQPMICKLEDGIYLATGHGQWSCALAPGTGKVIAELMFEGEAKSADISGLGHERFDAKYYADNMEQFEDLLPPALKASV